MEHGQAANEPYTHEAIDDKDNGSRCFGHSTPNSNIFRVLDLHNINPAKGEHKNAKESCREDKHVEEPVIPLKFKENKRKINQKTKVKHSGQVGLAKFTCTLVCTECET
jgi:hypothetical protein